MSNKIKNIISWLSLFLIMPILLISFTGCFSSYSKNDMEYWFSSYDTKFVKYVDEENNINEAGTYWNMTVKNDCKISIYITVNNNGYESGTYFYVNDKQVKSDAPGIFSYAYKNLDLKKGDKLKFHSFWTFINNTNDEGFKMSQFIIDDSTGNYPINNQNFMENKMNK